MDTGMNPSTLNWYKSGMISSGWIRKVDSIRSTGTSTSSRFVITDAGKLYLHTLREGLTAPARRKRKSPVHFIGDPDWEKIEVLIDSGMSLARTSRRLRLRPKVVWRKYRSYAKSGRRKELLEKLKKEGKIKSDIDEMLSRSPMFAYRAAPWSDVEIMLSGGKILKEISDEFGHRIQCIQGQV
jgi:hypothetical protein